MKIFEIVEVVEVCLGLLRLIDISRAVKVVEVNDGIIEFVDTFEINKIVEVVKTCGSYLSR